MKFKTQNLLNELTAQTQAIATYAAALKEQSLEQLNHRESTDSWSALECLQHLNLYGRFYIPELTRRLKNTKAPNTPLQFFKSGWLGNYFANSMLPKERLKKMKTFKEMNPIHSQLDLSVIDEFIDQQQQMLQLLEKARTADLTHTKVSISISKWIKLRLGDTFRFVIYHNMRHIQQAKRVLGERGF